VIGTIIAASISGLAAITASFIGVRNRKKLNEIHILVNSRLDQALSEINDLKTQRDIKQEQQEK
jgi:hypothetical protein